MRRWVLHVCGLSAVAAATASSPCDFERVDGTKVDAGFLEKQKRPIVLTGLTESWPARKLWPTAEAFSELHGSASGYARDHDQLELRDTDTTVSGYLAGCNAANRSLSSSFFVNDYEESTLLDKLQDSYRAPRALQHVDALRLISLECPGAGVAFHNHEGSWLAQLVGRKSWYLMSPDVKTVPLHYPCSFENAGASPPLAEQCTVQAGELIHLPNNWWHATCSLDTSLAIGGIGSLKGWADSLVAARHENAEGLKALLLTGGVDAPQVPAHSGIFMGGERPLYIAAALGRSAVVKALLDRNADPNIQRRDGRVALHEAARRGDVATMTLLLSARADLAAADKSANNALHYACAERGHVASADFLIAQGLQVGALLTDGRSALHVACRGHRNPVPLLRSLLQKANVAPNIRDKQGVTPLMLCAAGGHGPAVGLLLRFGGVEAGREVDQDGKDALDHALEGRGDGGVVSRLLAAGLPAEGRVLAAARLGELKPLQQLIEAGAAVSGAVLAAAKAGHAALVKALIDEFGGEVGEIDSDGKATALHWAAFGGHLSVVSLLLAADANVTAVDQDGLTAMHYTAATSSDHTMLARRQREIMEALAANAAQAGGPALWQMGDAQGTPPLHFAAAAGNVDLVRWMVWEQRVADPEQLNNHGASAADAAEQSNHSRLAALLRKGVHEEL